MTKEFIDYYSKNIANKVNLLKEKFLTWANNNISMTVCTNKQEHLTVKLVKQLNLFNFDFVAGANTFAYNKPDARHLTDVVEIIGGDLKTLMVVIVVVLNRQKMQVTIHSGERWLCK